jgi:hypothetical protein
MLRQLRSLSFPVKETATRAIASSAGSADSLSMSAIPSCQWLINQEFPQNFSALPAKGHLQL